MMKKLGKIMVGLMLSTILVMTMVGCPSTVADEPKKPSAKLSDLQPGFSEHMTISA